MFSNPVGYSISQILKANIMAIITISRGTFSGGQQLAKCIAENLGYRCIDREVLAGATRQYGVQEEKLYEALVKKPGVLERLYSDRVRYLAYIRAALAEEAQGDNIVYHGHAGHFLLNGLDNLIRVRVIANMEFRIEAAMERHQMNREEAVEFINRIDKERSIWTRFLYHVDWKDPSLYDLILNLDQLDIDSACNIVCHMAGMERFQTTPEAQKSMDNLVLSSTVKAILATHKEISDGNITIEADGSEITIFGTVGSMVDADRVRIIARTVPGVEEINSRMHVQLLGYR